MELFPNLHWVEAGYANSFLCIEQEGLALVDSGQPGRAETIFDYIRKIGRQPSELTRILITHADWDHVGSAAAIQEETGATVYAGPQTTTLLLEGKPPDHLPLPLRFIMKFVARYQRLPAPAVETVADGDTLPILEELTVLSTPGHTPDHHAFFSSRAGVLFAGDALSTRGGRLGLPPRIGIADLETARKSARRLLKLTPALFACGHGEPLHDHTLRDVMTLLQKLK